jgi:hypothetical protein
MTACGTYVRGSQFRLHVVAPSVLDAVQSAGGWVFDQVRLGWTVSVAVPDDSDDRPLRILGAEMCGFDSLLATVGADSDSAASLAFAVELFHQNDKVHEMVRTALARGRQQLLMWGEAPPSELHRTLAPVEHRLSCAARVFKAHALSAASAQEMPTACETFSGTKHAAATGSVDS